MRLSEIGELSLLKRIRERFNVKSKDIVAGIGDDAAVIIPGSRNILMTTDMMLEGVHFDLAFTTPYQLGFKAVSVNVSDIYAMCGTPRFLLLDVAMGKDTEETFIESFFNGVQSAMKLYRVALIGGDLSSSKSGVVISATLAGYANRPVMRSGAHPGDKIYVTGDLGDSSCGLELLKAIKRPVRIEEGDRVNKPLKWQIIGPLIRRHLLPEAKNPKRISRIATSMIDVSDGLFIDLTRLCEEGRVGARIYVNKIPISTRMKKAATVLGLNPYALATSGGEDYELLFTAPPRKKVDAAYIGEITKSGMLVVGIDGREAPLSPEGYQHWH